MRIVGPVAISLSQMKSRTFLIFNLFTALAWAIAGVSLGWLFGPQLAHFIRGWFTPQHMAITGAVAAALLGGLFIWRARRAAQPPS